MKMKSKNNWTMRAAVLMFALVLITSSFVGGTFAKYVTEGSGGSTARVAKFGVKIAADSHTMFNTSYATDDAGLKATIDSSVKSDPSQALQASLVAPGTFENDALTFSITGTPEVAVNVEFKVAGSDVFLKAGQYNDVTTAKVDDKFDLERDYYPVEFTLTQNGKEVKSGKIEDIVAYFNDLNKKANYPANTDLGQKLGTYNLSWKWLFDDTTKGTNDKADTLLGDLAASEWEYTGLKATDAVINPKFSTVVSFTIEAKVTQID